MFFGLLLIFLSFSSIPSTHSLEYIENDYQSGLMFQKVSNARVTYDSFTLLYHADLTHFFEIRAHIWDLRETIRRICWVEESNFCDILRLNNERRLGKVDRDLADINLYQLKQNTRPKRAISFAVAAGIISGFIGLITAGQAAYYGSQISKLETDYSVLKKIDTDGLLFMRQNIITEKQAYIDIRNITDQMLDRIKNISNENLEWFTRGTREFVINRLMQIINHWFMEHADVSELILTHLHSAIYGKYSHLIPVSQFHLDLIEIEKQLSDHQQLPINIHTENPLNIFKFSTTKTTIYENRLLIEITIPKMDRESYILYKIIPIPILAEGFLNIIIPSMEYILIDQSSANFIPIFRDEISNVPSNTNGEKIISPQNNIYHDYKDSCEMTLKLNPHDGNFKELCNFRPIPSTNYFIVLDSFNKFFLSLSKPTSLVEFCPGKSIQPKRITKSGFLTLSENCKIKTDKITLRPRINTIYDSHTDIELVPVITNFTSNMVGDLVKKFSTPEHLESPEPSILIDEHIKDFDNLADEADFLIAQISDKQITENTYKERISHNFFIVIGIVLLFFIGMSLFAYYLYAKFYNVKTWIRLANKFEPTVDIPLQDISKA